MFFCEKIYSVRIRPWLSSLYDNVMYSFSSDENLLKNGQSYQYDSLSLEELVVMAKKDDDAIGDVLNRLIDTIYRISVNATKANPSLEFGQIYYSLIDALHRAIKIFDPKKGEFLHFYRKMCSIITVRCNMRAYENQRRQERSYGYRVEYVEKEIPSAFMECNSLDENYRNKAIRLDLEDFIASLPEKKKRIFLMYLRQVPVGKIAELEGQPYTTIYSVIMQLIKKFNQR